MHKLTHNKASQIGAIAVFVLLPFLSFAQQDDLRIPLQLDADFTDLDGKSSMIMFRGLRLTQGSLGITANEGRATKMDFEDSVWHFDGDVVIDVNDGHIESDSAEMQFSGYELRLATLVGTPATFRLTRAGSDEETYAEAGRLEYNLETGVIEFSEQAMITEGGNQIASNYLVYNIREQRINASSGGDGEPKVRITYTPGDSNEAENAENDANDAGSAEPDSDSAETGDGDSSG